jgi:hypothetical protein
MNSNSAWWLPSKDQETRVEFENEYIRREFGLTLFSGIEEREIQLNEAKKGRFALVFIDSSVNNLKLLKNFPKRSVILFILSDETYKLKFNILKILNPQVHMIIRDYPLGDFWSTLTVPFRSIRKILRLSRVHALLPLLPITILSGFYIAWSQIFIMLTSLVFRKSILSIPLGYDSGFCKQYAKYFHLERKQSAIEFALALDETIKLKLLNEKYLEITFVGQEGSLDRRLMIEEARRELVINLEVNSDYSQGRLTSNQVKYFVNLKSSKFTLCPPGNYSAQTFRYFEALLLYAIPITDSFVFSDPLYRDIMGIRWPKFIEFYKRNGNSDDLYMEMLGEYRQTLIHYKNQIAAARMKFDVAPG